MTARACDARSYDWVGECKDINYPPWGVSGEICVCDTDKCNSAPMTSSSGGHVMLMAALLSSILISYLM